MIYILFLCKYVPRTLFFFVLQNANKPSAHIESANKFGVTYQANQSMCSFTILYTVPTPRKKSQITSNHIFLECLFYSTMHDTVIWGLPTKTNSSICFFRCAPANIYNTYHPWITTRPCALIEITQN